MGEVVDGRNRKYEEEAAEAERPEQTQTQGYTNAAFDDKSSELGHELLEITTVPRKSIASEKPASVNGCIPSTVSASGSVDGARQLNGNASPVTSPVTTGTASQVDERHSLTADRKRIGKLLPCCLLKYHSYASRCLRKHDVRTDWPCVVGKSLQSSLTATPAMVAQAY